jgi:hypothetical protein
MSCFVSMWQESQKYALQEAIELEAARAVLPKKGGWKRPVAALVVMLCSAIPALAIAATNGYFEDPPETLAPEKAGPAELQHIIVPVVVKAKAPRVKRVVYQGPRSCSERELQLYGGKVRVCARPASPGPAPRTTEDLVNLTRR